MIGVVLFVVIIIKPLAAMLTVRVLGQPLATAIPVGAAFSQVGEFSFILGTVALNLGLINNAGWNALVAASIISIALNPYIYRLARRLSSVKTAKQAAGCFKFTSRNQSQPLHPDRLWTGRKDCPPASQGPRC